MDQSTVIIQKPVFKAVYHNYICGRVSVAILISSLEQVLGYPIRKIVDTS